MRRQIIVKTMCIFLLVMCTFSLMFVGKSTPAKAENIIDIDEICDNFTNNSRGLDVKTYADDYKDILTKSVTDNSFQVKYFTGNIFLNNSSYKLDRADFYMEINGDDNITKFIPKELFTYTNEKFYYGTEYGFYINTRPFGYNYFSSVILFDIIRDTPENQDFSVGIKVETVANIDFYCINKYTPSILLDGSFSGTVKCKINYKSEERDTVVPMIRADRFSSSDSFVVDCSLKFKESTSFSASDFSFAASVYNTNALNYEDNNYSINNDYGYFLTGNSYDYNATLNQNGETKEGVVEIVTTLISSAIGCIPYIGSVFSLADTAISVSASVIDKINYIPYNVTNKNYYCPDLALYNTRTTQRDQYGNLIRFSGMVINSNSGNKLLFRVIILNLCR